MVPCPLNKPSLYFPIYFLPSDHVSIPFPFGKPSFHCPAYFDPFDSVKVPCPVAAIDTFENEPKPKIKILMNSKISLSPHIGAATLEAQDRIGVELAEKIIETLK